MTGAALHTGSLRIPSSLGGSAVRRGRKTGGGAGRSSARMAVRIGPAAARARKIKADGRPRRRDRCWGEVIQATKRLSGTWAGHSSTEDRKGRRGPHSARPGLTRGRADARFYMHNIYRMYIRRRRRNESDLITGRGGPGRRPPQGAAQLHGHAPRSGNAGGDRRLPRLFQERDADQPDQEGVLEDLPPGHEV